MLVMGVDVGKTGGWAMVAKDSTIQDMGAFDYEGYLCLIDAITKAEEPLHVFVEKVGAMPGNGGTSMFSFGTSYGTVLGILIAKAVPYSLVTPQAWTKTMHAGAKGGETKQRSIEVATRLFPRVSFLGTPKCKKPHMGMVEAALIAEYGRRTLKG